jgi:tetratricopeptide (TPR) repeat protein
MNQDYFVLHKIGLIHLLVEEHLDITKAKGYFKKAAKYASVESNNRLHPLTYLNNDNEKYEGINVNSTRINSNEIKVMASDSYEKAAFAAYILGEIVEANELQSKAVKLNASAQNHFFMGKYQIRGGQIKTGINHLNRAVELLPEILDLIITDLDLNTNIEVLNWIGTKIENSNNQIQYLKKHYESSKNNEKTQ